MADYLINGPISPELIASRISLRENRKDTGGHSVFLGQVRGDIIDGKEVEAIEYSAYNQMVNTEAERMISEIRNAYNDVLDVDLLHSVGIVKTGQISLFVMVSAGHRDHAIKACSQFVEMLKKRLPVWKKELFADDSHRWTENR